MPGTEVTYADVKFSKSRARGPVSQSPEVTSSEVRHLKRHIADSQPADLNKIQKIQARLKKKPRVTVERVALLVLSVLLAASIITLSITQTRCSKHQNASCENPTCPAPHEGKNETCLKCGAGWEKHGGSCYYFSTNEYSWNKSRRSCRDLGGDLVKIDSREEQTFLVGRLNNIIKGNLTEKFWIGLTDSKEEGTWLWVDGSALNESYWSDDQPGNKPEGNNSAREQDCVRMGTRKGTENLGSWFDRSCHDHNRYICEKAY